MKKLIFIIILCPLLLSSQTYTINDHVMHMSGNTSDYDVSINTFYNSIDTCNVSWKIIKDSLPSQWDISFCFPDCYPIGTTSSQDSFFPDEKNYLNCHIYPNGVKGYGIIEMEIITNNFYKDTVTWTCNISEATIIYNQMLSSNKNEINQFYDCSGKKTEKKTNTLLLYVNDRGVVQKQLILD